MIASAVLTYLADQNWMMPAREVARQAEAFVRQHGCEAGRARPVMLPRQIRLANARG
jgi:hypothetical protein